MSNFSVTDVAALSYSNFAKHIRYAALTGMVSTTLNWPNVVQDITKSGGFAISAWSVKGLLQNVGVLGTLLWLVLWALTTTAFAVNWHRRILKQEPFEALKLVWAKGPVFSYLWTGVLVAILCLLLALVTVLGATVAIGIAKFVFGGSFSFLGYIAGLGIGVYLLVLSVRMGISLVGKALGEIFYGPVSVLSFSKDMFWPIFGVFALVNIPIVIVTIFLEILNKTHSLSLSALTPLALVNNWFGMTVNLSLLTVLYAVLVQKKSIVNSELVDPIRVENPNDFFVKWRISERFEERTLFQKSPAFRSDSVKAKLAPKKKSARHKNAVAKPVVTKKKLVKAVRKAKTKKASKR